MLCQCSIYVRCLHLSLSEAHAVDAYLSKTIMNTVSLVLYVETLTDGTFIRDLEEFNKNIFFLL